MPQQQKRAGARYWRKTKKHRHPLKTAFHDAANNMNDSKNQLREFFRRISAKKGHYCATTATARKIASIVYVMLTRHTQFINTAKAA